MPWMTWRGATQLGVLLTLAMVFSVADVRSARAQDTPEAEPETPAELRDMPETLPADSVDSTSTAGNGSTSTTKAEEPASAEEPAPAGLRLEGQLLAAMAFPFGGHEHGPAFGFAITYGAGWGTIPLLIGLDFMTLGRSNSATSRVDATDDGAAATTVTRANSDRLLDFDVWLRVQPPRWPVRPYAEGFVGAKLVRTSWTISSHDEVAKTGSDSEWTSALGWGVGVDFMGLFNAVAAFSLTLGMRRLSGSQVELERLVVSDGAVVVRKRQVATNETIFIAGLCGRYDFEPAE
jgi:opacity protein-like surface antigen